ncbi:hypothetical protein Slala03_78870 [Streptomyces lavendulae subsp. lavendulae]|nr:hypothetical protein Slala03_78870 [Streptomyces lavendulae subsp. lavendulae]
MAGAGKVARMDGATYPAALTRAATTFATVITLAATATAVLASLLASTSPPISFAAGDRLLTGTPTAPVGAGAVGPWNRL